MPQGWTLDDNVAPGRRNPYAAPTSFTWGPQGQASPDSASVGPDGIPIAGYTPDYKGLIGNDPGYLQLQSDLAAGSISDRASLNAARQRALIQFGEVPGNLGQNLGLIGQDFMGSIGDAGQLAQQNTAAGLSTIARLNTANQDAVRTITNTLAGRGLLRSGETGFQQGKQGERYTQAQFDARQRLLDFLGQAQGQFTSAERARQAALAQGIFQAEANQVAAYPGQPGTVATRQPDGSYLAPDGRRFNPDGTPWTGGSQTVPQPPPPPLPAPPSPALPNWDGSSAGRQTSYPGVPG